MRRCSKARHTSLHAGRGLLLEDLACSQHRSPSQHVHARVQAADGDGEAKVVGKLPAGIQEQAAQ